ncbi:MAG: YitT family protein [Ruminococcaceae bacterium]|nr:YitT family protein [Oscillospiraceae bacterium]
MKFITSFKRDMKSFFRFLMIVLGSFVTAMGLNIFLIPFNISAGGVSGIGVILQHLFKIPVWFTVFVLNAVLIVFGFKCLEKNDLINSVISSLLLSLFLGLTENIVSVSEDMILNALFGGAVAGLGIGTVVAFGAATGGTDLLALMVNKKIPHLSVGNIMLFCDFTIIVLSAIVFKNFSLILYCLLTLFVSVKVTDYIIDGMDHSKSVYIISDKHKEISDRILLDIERGVTGICAKGMYSDDEKTMLMCIVRPREVTKIKRIVRDIDSKAFVILSDVSKTFGEGFSDKF